MVETIVLIYRKGQNNNSRVALFICMFLSSHKNKLPSSPPRWPIIVGNLLQLWQLSYRDLASLCNKYGPIVYLKLDKIDVITTNDFDIIRKILLSQDDVFASRPHTLVVVHLAYGCGDVALAPLGPHWKPMRRICMKHLLRRKRLESFSKHRLDEVQHLVKDVLVRAQDEKPINLREARTRTRGCFATATSEIGGRAVFVILTGDTGEVGVQQRCKRRCAEVQAFNRF
ncbi:hypothetical protein JHK82_016188 [Glycine max]|nr:hypothetical protein JHK85_016586 [Glycine max]KAG5046811.1 hypothetical protein JHK86_016217 [Glycine max]KAG5149307.1 hypothetical protein JHK82_016188 [Glycine max]